MDGIWQLVIAIATLAASLGAMFIGLRVQKQTDGMLKEMKADARAKGVTQGKAEGKAEEIQFQRDNKENGNG